MQLMERGNENSALGGSSALHIPAFPGGGCLIDYVPQVCQLLTNKVQYVIQGYHKRREYIAAFLSHFGTGVVEYDAEGFTKLTLLLMWKDFCFLVHIDLPLYFPRDQPTLTFQSVYHFTNSGQLYSQAQKNYPYSPRWDGNEMAKRANPGVPVDEHRQTVTNYADYISAKGLNKRRLFLLGFVWRRMVTVSAPENFQSK
ncbi:BRCA1-A complex subunit BRE-like protein [Turdus rufiventris]|nr:BRCA1-A complex subunit BRE-like protein [Turdus rufiventris]